MAASNIPEWLRHLSPDIILESSQTRHSFLSGSDPGVQKFREAKSLLSSLLIRGPSCWTKAHIVISANLPNWCSEKARPETSKHTCLEICWAHEPILTEEHTPRATEIEGWQRTKAHGTLSAGTPFN
uniref:Uncharacterized protein n=1 Tax=Bionectria ochroleuca TaxID=29856 RepID=A0A8H7TTX3_BIOOC